MCLNSVLQAQIHMQQEQGCAMGFALTFHVKLHYGNFSNLYLFINNAIYPAALVSLHITAHPHFFKLLTSKKIRNNCSSSTVPQAKAQIPMQKSRGAQWALISFSCQVEQTIFFHLLAYSAMHVIHFFCKPI